VGASTDAARAEVLARRQLLLDEVVALKASGRASVDIPARVRRSPVKSAALAAGAAFVVVGGPRRTYRGIRRRIFGPKAELPKSMLPEEIDKAIRSLGDDGEKVRGTIEYEFAKYLEQTRQERRSRQLRGTLILLGASFLKPITQEGAKRLTRGIFGPDSGSLIRGVLKRDSTSFAEATQRIQSRKSDRETSRGSGGKPPAPAA
jgi:hypothetical protein